MPHYVPFFEWTDKAIALRRLNYEYWCANGHGPNLRDVHEALGYSRTEIIQTYKELALGIACTIDPDSQNCPVLRFQPFASFPSQVKAYVDGRFHSYAGCAMEAVAFSNMPPFAGRTVRLESYCMCCLAPIGFTAVDGEVVERPASILVHVSTSPVDWFNHDLMIQCDSMNFVIDADHAERYERMTATRGIRADLDQARAFVGSVGNVRMHDYHWPVGSMDPAAVIEGFRAAGVDVSPWGA